MRLTQHTDQGAYSCHTASKGAQKVSVLEIKGALEVFKLHILHLNVSVESIFVS